MNIFWAGFIKRAASVLDYGKILGKSAKKVKKLKKVPVAEKLDYSDFSALKQNTLDYGNMTGKTKGQLKNETEYLWKKRNAKR